MVRVRGRGWLKLLNYDAFTSLVEAHWAFLAVTVVGLHFATFFVFALFWLLLRRSSPSCLGGFENGGFNAALIFSVATQTTLGYGTRSIRGACRAGAALLFAQIVVGVFVNALSLGVIFARITDPKHRARSIFVSDAACVATRDGELKFMFRVADARDRKVIAPAVRACLYAWNGRVTREGERLPVSAQPLRISKLDPLMLLPITIEHVIDETSPLFGHTHDSLCACHAEIVVAFEGCVDATGLSFSARQSYLPSEILWGTHVPPDHPARAERVHQARGGARALPRAGAAGNAGESRGAQETRRLVPARRTSSAHRAADVRGDHRGGARGR